jgi:hypothetical protein
MWVVALFVAPDCEPTRGQVSLSPSENIVGQFAGLIFDPDELRAEPKQVDGSFLGHVTIRPCTCALSNMSEVAADNSRLTPEVLTEADGKGPGEATARVLAEIHKGTTGDDSPIVVRQTPQR